MTSQALPQLLEGVDEVRALRTHYPVPYHGIATGSEAVAAKAHGRACVVLLSSHLDRYVHAVNEEAVDWLNAASCTMDRFADEFLLLHSRSAVDQLAERDWLNRGEALRAFVATQGTIWLPGATTGQLQHDQLLVWMKSPKPESLVRFYRLYGIDNIFKSVTRTPSNRGKLYLGIRELVEKRNNIAHGDAQTEALPLDVTRYLQSVSRFASSADKALARALRHLASVTKTPW